jgi:hypothetical protein
MATRVTSTDVATIDAHNTIGHFTIHAHDVLANRQVTIIASAVVEKRVHLTVERA